MIKTQKAAHINIFYTDAKFRGGKYHRIRYVCAVTGHSWHKIQVANGHLFEWCPACQCSVPYTDCETLRRPA